MTQAPTSPTRPPREITPRDVPLMEPDLLGALSMMLHGRASPPSEKPAPSEPDEAEAR